MAKLKQSGVWMLL